MDATRTKNRWLLLGVATLMIACVVIALLALLLPARSGVTKDNFDRIEVGMTRAEVEKVFGGKANSFGGGGLIIAGDLNRWQDENTEDEAEIHFDDNDCVQAKAWWPSPWPDDRTPWEKLVDRVLKNERPRLPRPNT